MVNDSAIACTPITSAAECETAAQQLGFNATAVDISQNIPPNKAHTDPPYCYIEDNVLKYNSDESYTGTCGVGTGLGSGPQFTDYCLCHNIPSEQHC